MHRVPTHGLLPVASVPVHPGHWGQPRTRSWGVWQCRDGLRAWNLPLQREITGASTDHRIRGKFMLDSGLLVQVSGPNSFSRQAQLWHQSRLWPRPENSVVGKDYIKTNKTWQNKTRKAKKLIVDNMIFLNTCLIFILNVIHSFSYSI